MKKLTDADIIPNYYHAAHGYANEGAANCRRCGASAKTGAIVHGWTRYSNRAVHLPRFIGFCDICDRQIRHLQSNLPKP